MICKKYRHILPPLPKIIQMHEDPHISQAIQRIARHTIKHRVTSLVAALEFSCDEVEQDKLKTIFKCFAKYIANKDNQIEQAIKIVHNLHVDEIRCRYPELNEKEISDLSKSNTKKLIKQIIRDEYFKNFSLKNTKNNLQTNIASVSSADKTLLLGQDIQKGLQVSSISTSRITKIEARPFSNCKDSSSYSGNKGSHQSKQQQKRSFYSQHISIDIPKFNITFQTQQWSQNQDVLYDPIKDTDSFGHFLYGDKPEEITEVFPIIDELFGTVSWKSREDGFVPQPSSLSIQCIRIYAPLMLAEYYETCLMKKQEESADSRQPNRSDKNW